MGVYDPTKVCRVEHWFDHVKVLQIYPRVDATALSAMDDDDDDDLEVDPRARKKRLGGGALLSKPRSPAGAAAANGEYSNWNYPVKLELVPFSLDRTKQITLQSYGGQQFTDSINSFWYRIFHWGRCRNVVSQVL